MRGARAAAVAAYFGIAAALWVSDSVHLATMLLELNALETVRAGSPPPTRLRRRSAAPPGSVRSGGRPRSQAERLCS